MNRVSKFISIILIFYIACLFSSCYTVVKEGKTPREKQVKYLTHELIGTWIKKTRVGFTREYEYGYKVKKIIFSPYGEIIYSPEWSGLTSYTGVFKVKEDTLDIELLNNSLTETLTYKITGSKLMLQKTNNNLLNIEVVNGGNETWEWIE